MTRMDPSVGWCSVTGPTDAAPVQFAFRMGGRSGIMNKNVVKRIESCLGRWLSD